MATCRDCFHCRACHEMYLVAVAQEDDFFERHDAETCEDFVNKADVAEVVRCEKCKYGMKSWLQPSYIEKQYLCSKDDSYQKPNHFCSYGERRDT